MHNNHQKKASQVAGYMSVLMYIVHATPSTYLGIYKGMNDAQ